MTYSEAGIIKELYEAMGFEQDGEWKFLYKGAKEELIDKFGISEDKLNYYGNLIARIWNDGYDCGY